MDPSLIGNFIRFSTAKQVWDSIATTYFDGSDTSQVYDLKRRVTRMKQSGESIETYYNCLQGLWREIDFRRPNPMECAADIQRFNDLLQENRVYTFLDGLDDRLDNIRSDVLQLKPFPTVEQAYAYVRREAIRQTVMLTNNGNSTAAAMVSRGGKTYLPRQQTLQINRAGMAPTAGRNLHHLARPKGQVESEGSGCSHCGNMKHTRETCFKLHGYPDWWSELKTRKQRTSSGDTGQASLANTKPQLSLAPLVESGEAATSLPNDQGNTESKNDWIVDSGATDHMTYCSDDFSNTTEPRRTGISNANGVVYPVTGAGTVHISTSLLLTNTLLVRSLSNKLLSVSQVTEDLNCVVLMYPKFCLFQDILTKKIIGRGTKREGLYYVDDFNIGNVNTVRRSLLTKENQIWLWHYRLGHPSFSYMKYLFPELFLNLNYAEFKCETCILAKSHRVSFPISLNKSDTPFALVHSDVWGPSPITTVFGIRWFVTFVDDCTRMTWLYLLKRKDEVFDVFCMFEAMVHTQFSANIQILQSDNGEEYVNHNFVEFFRTKGILHEMSCSQTPQQNGVAERKNRHILETARALLFGAQVPGRYWSDSITTAVYLLNRMPSKALDFKTPLQALSQYVTLPSILLLPPRVFGCVAFVHIHKHLRTKLEPCAVRCIFWGYGSNKKGFRCYDPKTKRLYITMDVTFLELEYFYPFTAFTSPLQGEIWNEDEKWWTIGDVENVEVNEVTGAIGDVENNEGTGAIGDAKNNEVTGAIETVVMTSTVTDAAENTEGTPVGTTENAENVVIIDEDDEGTESMASDSISKSPSLLVPDNDNPLHEDDPEVISHTTPTGNILNSSNSYHLPFRQNRGRPPSRYSPDTKGKKAKYPVSNYVSTQRLPMPLKAFAYKLSSGHIPLGIHEALADPKWSQAIQEEMTALEKNQTWEIVTLPQGKRTVGCKWVFSTKYKADGSIERHKARLVAKGYTQTYGIDYQEIFSPVAKLNTVRVLLSIAKNLDWPLHQFDVKNAFLHGDLEEEVYMDIPPGYNSNTPGTVCRLQRALYGLKQSPRAWFGRFSVAMRKYGFQQSNSDHTLFLKRQRGKVTVLIIYVDDMIITGDDEEEIKRLQKQLSGEFEMKDLGGLKYFLGIEVARSKRGIFLSQRKYVLDLLTEVGMLDCKPADTPTVQNQKLGVYPDQEPADKERYQRLVGKLIYLSHTRPDISYAVSLVSQFMHCPSKDHMDAVSRILQYLKSAPGRGLMLSKNDHLKVEGYTDADWAGNVFDRKSTSGYFTFVGGNLVTWRSKKQKVVALSSAEAEFRGMAKGLCELLWIRRLLSEIGFTPKSRMNLYCDNKAAIAISQNPIQHDRTKHIEIDRHFIKQNLEEGVICFPFVRSEGQLADVLTKAVSNKVFQDSLSKLGIEDIFAPT